jgi:signal transduction histidine kinase
MRTAMRGTAMRGDRDRDRSWDRERDRDARALGRERRHHHHRNERAETEAAREAELALLPPEERALREARWRAERKVRLAREGGRFALVVVPLLIFLPPVGLVVAFCWGTGLARELWSVLVEPRVRRRFLEAEVRQQVSATLSQERSELEGHHARSLEQLAAGVAHEIRNPITAAKSLVQQMEEDPRAAENVEYARVALAELERVERSVSHLLRYAREEETELAPVRMADVVDSALETFRERAARSGIALRYEHDRVGELRGDAEKLRRVVINLVGNAFDALEAARTPEPRVEVALGENLAGSEVWVRVRDNGPGLDAEAREKLWTPFYTSKPAGTGLGLAITKKLVEAHGGSVEVASQPGRGAEFLVTLPRREPRREARA